MNLDAVFAAIDRTESTVGQQILYSRVRTAPRSETLDQFELLVERMRTDADGRERAQSVLARLKDAAGYDLWWLARTEDAEIRWWYALFPVLAAGSLLALLLMSVSPLAAQLVIIVVIMSFPIRLHVAKRLGPFARSFGQIGPLTAAAAELKLINDAMPLEMLSPLVRDLPRLKTLRLTANWLSRVTLNLDPLSAAVLELINLLFFVDANAWYFGARQLRTRGPHLLRVLQAVGEVDAAIAVASFRHGTNTWARPVFHPKTAPLTIVEGRHPLLNDGVPNSLTVAPPYGLVITGSNMSGKTTFLRMVGISAVLSQTINTCLAKRYEAPVFWVRSCIGTKDDLLTGKSYYLAEADAIIELLRDSEGEMAHLFLIDEIFRGTNASERVAAGEAVLRRLVSLGHRHVCLVATHDGGLVNLLADCYEPFHFGDALNLEGLDFDYKLKPGPTTTRNAIALLKLRGAPADVIEAARRRASLLDLS